MSGKGCVELSALIAYLKHLNETHYYGTVELCYQNGEVTHQKEHATLVRSDVLNRIRRRDVNPNIVSVSPEMTESQKKATYGEEKQGK